MIRKLWVTPLLLSLAGLLVAADFAQAQRRGGGGGRGGNWGGNNSGWSIGIGPGGIYGGYSSGGGNWNRGGYYGNNWGGGNYGRGGYYGNNWGGGLLGGGLYGYSSPYYGGGYSSGYYAPSYSYTYPSTTYYAEPASSYYAAPAAPQYAAPAPVTNANAATIRVIVPDPQARVTFDGNLTQQTGTDRQFHTPPLSASASNSYRIRASWMEGEREVVQERVANVSPGGNILIDFTQSN